MGVFCYTICTMCGTGQLYLQGIGDDERFRKNGIKRKKERCGCHKREILISDKRAIDNSVNDNSGLGITCVLTT